MLAQLAVHHFFLLQVHGLAHALSRQHVSGLVSERLWSGSRGDHAPLMVCRGMAMEPDYYIATIDTGQAPLRWRWELRRHSSPMGVIVGRSGYQSEAAAEYAGKRELESFLNALAKEERYRR